MSVIPLFYGQCGSQICETLYSNIYDDICNSKKHSDYYTQSLNKWFQESKKGKWESRAVLIDTEGKTAPRQKNAHYQFKNIVLKSCGGSANNWAFGYFHQSKLLQNQIQECIRKEVEKSNAQCSFLNVFSSSGGTGSGVGSSIIEFLKNEFPNRPITNAIILPFSDGELVTQSYNSLLALAKVYPISDSIVLFENDRLHYNCINALNLKDVTFDDVNMLIAHQLLSIYQPLKDVQTPQLLTKLCQDPYNFLQIRLAPLSKLDNACNWKALLASISRQSRFDLQQKSSPRLKLKSLSTAFICRGIHNPEEQDFNLFKDANFCKTIQIYHQRKRIFNLDNCLTVVSNNNSIFTPIKSILQDAWNLYKYGAYLHHYKQYGVDEVYFKSSFEIMERVSENYKKL